LKAFFLPINRFFASTNDDFLQTLDISNICIFMKRNPIVWKIEFWRVWYKISSTTVTSTPTFSNFTTKIIKFFLCFGIYCCWQKSIYALW
jgi:hypothetical protein